MKGNGVLLGRVLFPTDFSMYTQATFEYIRDLQGVGEAVLMNVIDNRHLTEEVEILTIRAKAELAKLEAAFGKKGVPVRSLIKVGTPSQEIAKTADEVDASLILMGARGTSLFREMFLGSTTLDVMRQSTRPILIIRFKMEKERVCRDLLGKILFATDFSEPSRRALVPLKGLKEAGAKELVLVHVVDRGETEEEVQKLHESAEKELKGIEDEFRADGWRVKTNTVVGIASKEIMSLAVAENASLIAVGARGQGINEKLIVGSTTEALARRADMPVLILR